METNKEKLERAKKLLREINKNWKEEEVLKYGCSLSFDELVEEIESIHIK